MTLKDNEVETRVIVYDFARELTRDEIDAVYGGKIVPESANSYTSPHGNLDDADVQQ